MKHTLLEEIDRGSRTAQLKLNILKFYVDSGDNTLSELGKEMDLSIPTVTKLVGELIDEGYVIDFGKVETTGGRHPNIYGLNPDSGCFLGVDIKKFRVNLALINFKGEMIDSLLNVPFNYENTIESFDSLCKIIENYISSFDHTSGEFVDSLFGE